MDVEGVQAQAQLVRQKDGTSLMETEDDRAQACAGSVHEDGNMGEVEDPQVQGGPVHEESYGQAQSSARSSERLENHEMLTGMVGRDAARITSSVSTGSSEEGFRRIPSYRSVFPILQEAGNAGPFYRLLTSQSRVRKSRIDGRKGRIHGSRDWERATSVDGVQNSGLDLGKLQLKWDACIGKTRIPAFRSRVWKRSSSVEPRIQRAIGKDGSTPNHGSLKKKRSGSWSDVPFVSLETDSEGEPDNGYSTP